MDILNSAFLIRNFRNAYLSRYNYIIPNVYIDLGSHEMDIFALRKSGLLDEVEVKISVSDFKADFKKSVTIQYPFPVYNEGSSYPARYGKANKHEKIASGKTPCNRFYFLVPEAISNKISVPDHAGLLVWKDNDSYGIREVKPAPLLHRTKVDKDFIFSIVSKCHFKMWDLIRDNDYMRDVVGGYRERQKQERHLIRADHILKQLG